MSARTKLALPAAALMLAGCAGAPEGAFPSLAIRDVERVTGTLAPPPVFTPAAPAPATLDRLAALRADAAEAHARFLAAAPAARASIGAASRAATGSERWARAQVALAGLETIRGQAMIALADLDRIYVDAATSGGALASVAAARDEVARMVEEEDRLIDSLIEVLR